jgi:tetratricopeptide (TPR) repeat protein
MRVPALFVAFLALSAFAAAQGAEEKQLALYKKAYEVAKKNLAAKPKDPKVKQAFVVAGDRFAMATMTAPSLPPRAKYSGALRLYREVLKVDPKNKEAANNSKMIIDIYKQMGRPVPN